MPPPQPTSSTRAPSRLAWREIHSRRSGLISCSGRNSPSGSHQRWARLENFSSSAWSTFKGLLKQKTPPERGFVLGETALALLPPRADDLDFHAPVGLQPVDHLLVRAGLLAEVLASAGGDRLLLALALGVDAVRRHALGHEIGLDRFRAADRKTLVVGVRADRVRMTDRDDDLKVDAAHLVREVVELRAAFGPDHRLVELEQHIGRKGHFLGHRLGLLRLGLG